ncbi:MAG: ATP-binding protein [Bacteroidota bacterium]
MDNSSAPSTYQILESKVAVAQPDVDIAALLQLLRKLLQFHLGAGEKTAEEREKWLTKSKEIAVFPNPNFPWTDEARIAWLISLLPHLGPNLLDNLLKENLEVAGDFPQFGGTKGERYRGIIPTGETILFFLAGFREDWRRQARELFSADHFFAEKRLLLLDTVPAGEPIMSGKLLPNPDVVEYLLVGREPKPHFSMQFPAERLTTQLDWEDLIVNPSTMTQLQELLAWVEHGETLLKDWKLGKRVKPGYRALFHGMPGTGKTLTASLLGKRTGTDVYRVDLSMVISKYIGETEKNLANLFAKAENKGWVLFFDEADALFGKRTGVKDAHDKYANQEVSYLLQRVEAYDGLVILASNFKSNIDEAFMRRFQSVIYFPMPSVNERLRLWQSAWPAAVDSESQIDILSLARQYELSGATINNVVQKACLRLLATNERVVTKELVLEMIRNEMSKEGKII